MSGSLLLNTQYLPILVLLLPQLDVSGCSDRDHIGDRTPFPTHHIYLLSMTLEVMVSDRGSTCITWSKNRTVDLCPTETMPSVLLTTPRPKGPEQHCSSA